VSTFGSAARGTSITPENIVDWGGAKELNRDNYYITEESKPAKLGASLGWLLQLDGDNLRTNGDFRGRATESIVDIYSTRTVQFN